MKEISLKRNNIISVFPNKFIHYSLINGKKHLPLVFHHKEDTREDIYFRMIMLIVLKTNNGSNKNNKMYLRNQCCFKKMNFIATE